MEKINDIHFDKSLDPKLAELYGMLSETRSRLLEQVEGLTQEQLDYSPQIKKFETIGTLLFHIAAIEFSWFFEDIFKEEMEYKTWKYAFALRETLDPPQLTGKPLSFYLEKLDLLRDRVYEELQKMEDKDLANVIDSGNKKFTVYWILYHINYHECIHIGQINFLKRMYQNKV